LARPGAIPEQPGVRGGPASALIYSSGLILMQLGGNTYSTPGPIPFYVAPDESLAAPQYQVKADRPLVAATQAARRR